MLGRTLAMVVCAWGVATTATASTLLFSPEGNRLNVYDVDTLPVAKRTLIQGYADAPEDPASRDINGQICFRKQDGEVVFISGEDTVGAAGGGSHAERIAGWGVFELTGDTLATLSATQVGKLNPTYLGDPDNFGCGFLPDGRLVTTAIGNVNPGEVANGELIMWFPPLDVPQPTDGDGNRLPSTNFCKLDTGIPTTGGVYVDGETIYVASNRPNDGNGEPSGVWKFTPGEGGYPTAPNAAGGCSGNDGKDGPLVDAGRVEKEIFVPNYPVPLPADPFSLTPSSVVESNWGTFFVSSVFTGTIAEYDAAGNFLRWVMAPPFGGQGIGITPFGLAVDRRDGTLYVADLGIVAVTPVPMNGSVARIRFVTDLYVPLPPEPIDLLLTFPDGLGVITFD